MAAKKKVLVVQGLHQAGLDVLAARPDVEAQVLMSADEAEIADAARDAQAITVRTASITRAVIDATQALRVVARHGVGYDAVDVGALTERNIPLALAIRSNMVSVAEHAMMMLLALAKNAAHYDAVTRRADWSARWNIQAWDLAQKSLLIVGFGRTGARVARRALAFDMKVFACDPYIDADLIARAGCTPVNDLHAALPQMDAVTLHCPKTPETTGLIGEAALALMKPTALLVNCARGGLVDEGALHAALTSGRLRGAGLDVFAREPSPSEHPLFELPNVVLSPHIAGVTVESTVRMSTQTAQNALDAIDGRLDPATVVNRSVLDL